MSETNKIGIVTAFIFIIAFVEGFIIGGQMKEKNFFTDTEYVENLLPTLGYLEEIGAGGVYVGDGRIVCLPDIYYCQHEIGHALDDFIGYPSETDEWKNTVDSFVEGCIEEYIASFFCGMSDYAGINGNPMHIITDSEGGESDWGGYSELYANIFELSRNNLKRIPEPLGKFFDIGWNE